MKNFCIVLLLYALTFNLYLNAQDSTNSDEISEGTNCSQVLFDDTIKSLSTILNIDSCGDNKVSEIFVSSPPQGKTGKQEWKERWILIGCENEILLNLLFKEDGNGGAFWEMESLEYLKVGLKAIEGKWAWQSDDDGCVSKYHKITFDPSSNTYIFTFNKPFNFGHNKLDKLHYKLLKKDGKIFKLHAEEEYRRDSNGKLVDWNLILYGTYYGWERCDRPGTIFFPVNRCPE